MNVLYQFVYLGPLVRFVEANHKGCGLRGGWVVLSGQEDHFIFEGLSDSLDRDFEFLSWGLYLDRNAFFGIDDDGVGARVVDPFIIDPKESIPIEIKSPGEEFENSVKGVR